ncbi:hypothetical protein ACFLTE_09720 [Bacteroidota bacterium]
MRIKIYFFIMVCLIFNFEVQAFEYKKLPIKVSFLNETVNITPAFRFLKHPVHPGLLIGTEFLVKEKPNSDFHISSNMGFYHHKKLQNGFLLNSEIGYRYNFNFGLNLNSRFGLGYLHTFYPGEVYKQTDEGFKEITDYGKPHLLASLSIGTGYTLKSVFSNPVEIFCNYQLLLEAPFATKLGLPFLIHYMLNIGIKFYPFTKND